MSRNQVIAFAMLGISFVLALAFGVWQFRAHHDALNEIAIIQTSNEQAKLEIQQTNKELGLARSQLLTQRELGAKYEGELSELQEKIKKLTGAKRVKPISRDETVVVVDNTVTGGTTTTTPVEGRIAYFWESSDKRFHLTDPDIYTQNNEEFNYELQVRLRGYIMSDEDGKLQARQVTAEEVVRQPDGTLQPTGHKVEIAENQFEYVAPQLEKSLWDIFNPRVQFQFDTLANPGVAVEVANLGNYIDWANVGVNAQTSVNVRNGVDGLKESGIGVGISYSLIRPLLDTNVSVGVGILTPVNDLGGKAMLTANVGFYLTN